MYQNLHVICGYNFAKLHLQIKPVSLVAPVCLGLGFWNLKPLDDVTQFRVNGRHTAFIPAFKFNRMMVVYIFYSSHDLSLTKTKSRISNLKQLTKISKKESVHYEMFDKEN